MKIKKKNAAQVLQGFICKNEINKFKLSIDNKISIEQGELLEYLMKFQEFIFKT